MTTTYRPSAYCLDCGEEEYLYSTDCCSKFRPGCATTTVLDSDDTINVITCRSGNGCQIEVTA